MKPFILKTITRNNTLVYNIDDELFITNDGKRLSSKVTNVEFWNFLIEKGQIYIRVEDEKEIQRIFSIAKNAIISSSVNKINIINLEKKNRLDALNSCYERNI